MRHLVGLFVAGVAALLVGCASTSLPPADSRVTIAADLADDIQVMSLKCVRDAGGYLELQSTLVNRKAVDCEIEWRVVWLGADGLEIPSAVSNWSKRQLSANDVGGMRNVAPSRDAVDFRLNLRRLRR